MGNPGQGLARYAYPGVPLPRAVRDYDEIEFAARRPLTNGWTFSASYEWSRLHGNYAGLSQSDENGRTMPNVGRDYDSPFVMFDEHGKPLVGPLATDRPHQFKGTLVYQAPFRLHVGVFQFVASGIPITRETRLIPGVGFPLMYRGRASDGRTPVLSQTDHYVQQDLAMSRGTQLSVGLSVTNLFDQDTAIANYIVEPEVGAGLLVSEEDFFAGRLNVQQAMAQQNIRTDPRFLRANAFQAPRTARVLLKWSF